jgi:hypothetical protein
MLLSFTDSDVYCGFLDCIVVLFIADFITGLFHWAEDTYFTQNTPLIGRIIRDNDTHHEYPYIMGRYTLLETISSTLPFTLGITLLALICGVTSWKLYLLMFILSFSNLIHKWTHMRDAPEIVKELQRLGILLSPDHHRIHHRTLTSHYCVLTDFLNPHLEYICFWRLLEEAIQLFFNVKPRQRTVTN